MPYDTAPTVNKQEVEKFKKLSTDWWDENGEAKPLHSLNKIILLQIKENLINSGVAKKEFIGTSMPLQDLQILEVGCGGGILTERLATTGATVVGLDIVPELIETAKQHATLNSSLTKFTYLLESVEDHCLQNFEKYDVVITSGVIEHVNEQEIFLNACSKCLKPGGSIFISTFNKTMSAWIGGVIIAENILRIVPRGTHDWNKFISPEEVESILKKSKCNTQKVRGIFYNMFRNTWFWIESSFIFYVLHAIKESSMN